MENVTRLFPLQGRHQCYKEWRPSFPTRRNIELPGSTTKIKIRITLKLHAYQKHIGYEAIICESLYHIAEDPGVTDLLNRWRKNLGYIAFTKLSEVPVYSHSAWLRNIFQDTAMSDVARMNMTTAAASITI